MMSTGFKSQSSIVLPAAALVVLSAFYFHENIFFYPSFIHAWTQSDRYALALGFINNGFDFFHPETFNLATVNGITRVDFPIHEYMVALLMKLTGHHDPVVFRLYTLIYALVGLIFLYRMAALFGDRNFLNLLVPSFIFLCPVYLYYADGFIPSIPSLSNLFIGYYFYFSYQKQNRNSHFTIAVCFMLLAALARLPYFIFLFAVLCQQSLMYLQKRQIRRREIAILFMAVLLFGAYQAYNSWLEKTYGTQFLVSIMPAGKISQAKEWLWEAWNNWRFEYFTKAQYVILFWLIAMTILAWVQKSGEGFPKKLMLHIIIISIGSIIYLFLMLQQFPDHDYYFIDVFYPVTSLLLVLLTSYTFNAGMMKYVSALLVFILLGFSCKQSHDVLQKRYETGSWDRNEITRKNFTGADKFLDALGIPSHAKALVLDGYTTNVPLMLMNRKGWTVNWTTKKNIDEGLSQPFDFVAVQNCFLPSEVLRNEPQLIKKLKKFADNGRISIYVRNADSLRTTSQFLGIDTTTIVFEKKFPDTLAVSNGNEFTELISDSASIFQSGRPVKLLITGEIYAGQTLPYLNASVNDGENVAYYFSYQISDYLRAGPQWNELLYQFVIPAEQKLPGTAKVYFWNSQKQPFMLRNIRLVAYR